MTRALTQRRWFDLAGLLVPGRCGGCRRPSPALDGILCGDCAAALRDLPSTAGALFLDQAPASRLVRLAKHGSSRQAAHALLSIGISRVAGTVDARGIDVATWVPPAPGRALRRGWCLPEALARAIAGALGVPCEQLLVRTDMTAQRGRSRGERIAGAHRSYALAPQRHEHRDGERVLVVDDVRTTGATLAATCDILESAGSMPVPLAICGVPRRGATFQTRPQISRDAADTKRVTHPP